MFTKAQKLEILCLLSQGAQQSEIAELFGVTGNAIGSIAAAPRLNTQPGPRRLGRITPRKRQAVLALHDAGHDAAQVAEMLGLAQATVDGILTAEGGNHAAHQ